MADEFALSECGQHRQVSAEAARIREDTRRAVKCNPEGAQPAPLPLDRVLIRSTEPEPSVARGGLAPWQKHKVDRYLNKHLGRPLHTEEIASQVSLSARHFRRAFKKTYGTTPHTQIVALRLKRALQLIQTTQYPLSQIALVCGMADQSHLSKLFRRGVGATPGAWRRGNRDDDAEPRSRRSKTSRSVSLED